MEGTPASRAGLTSKSNQAKGHCPQNFALSFPKAEIPQSPLAAVLLLNHVWWQNIFLPSRMHCTASCWLLLFLETAPPPPPSWASTRPNVPLQNVELRTKCDFSWCGYQKGTRDVSSLPGPVLAGAVKEKSKSVRLRKTDQGNTALSICSHASEQLFISKSPFSWWGIFPVQLHRGRRGSFITKCRYFWLLSTDKDPHSSPLWGLWPLSITVHSILHLSKDAGKCRKKFHLKQDMNVIVGKILGGQTGWEEKYMLFLFYLHAE